MKNNLADWVPFGDPMEWIKQYGLRSPQSVFVFADEQDPIHKQNTLLRQQLFVNQGWRLSRRGVNLFTSMFNHYASSHDDNRIMTGKVLLNMDNAVKGPWGYKDSTIIVFDHTIHFELQMCNGSAQQYIAFKN